ncbi:unnamed protein product [Plutella xylostella]|uniref:(diamondback moth) hypothetical protein n=1 Tax=Plutella xylostella TaxID=51655 RepID=A0A8S4EQ28_PLUXY|nr:unnamed protein product [Plutella xylostella]
MIGLLVRIVLAYLVLNHLFAPCTAFRSSLGRSYSAGKSNSKGYKEQAKGNTFAGSSEGLPSQPPARRGLGISAWGLITVIVSLGLAGMGFYYFSICYPILCKKQRKYDIIELANV